MTDSDAQLPQGASSPRSTSLRGRPPGRWLIAIALGFSPGALEGIYIAGLLFFLNPHWPFEPISVLRAVARYSTLLGLGSCLLIAPIALRRPRWLHLWPWGMVVQLAFNGVLYWVQAAHYSFFLPVGINRRLLKAAIGLSIATVLGFYTLLVPALRRRRPGPRGRIFLVLVVLATVYVVFERREAFRPPAPAAPRPSRVTQPEKPNLVLVGIPCATLDAVLPLAEQGRLPFLATALRQGAYARLSTLSPTDPVATWASVVTGRLPYEHGLLGHHRYPAGFVHSGADFRLLPIGILFPRWGLVGGALPTRHDAARALTIWEITQRLGVGTVVAGWPEPLVAQEEQEEPAAEDGTSKGPDWVVPIEELDDFLDPAGRRRTGDDLNVTSIYLHLQENTHSESAAFLFLPGLEAVARATYGAYVQAVLNGSSKPAAVDGARILTSYYTRLDDILEQLWTSTPAPRLLVVVSAYGIEEASTGPWPLVSQHGSTRGAPDGLLIVRGDGIRTAGLLNGVGILDVVPTLLYSLGFPAARDLGGRTLTEVFEPGLLELRPLTFVPSYETTLPFAAGGTGSASQRRQ